jgi:hypothetical protein
MRGGACWPWFLALAACGSRTGLAIIGEQPLVGAPDGASGNDATVDAGEGDDASTEAGDDGANDAEEVDAADGADGPDGADGADAPDDAGTCPRPVARGPLRQLSFSSATHFASRSYAFSLAMGDFNGDCIPDLILPFGDFVHVAVLLGRGDGTFAPALEGASSASTTYPIDIASGDFNRDGKLDVVITGAWFSPTMKGPSILLGNGDGTFQPARVLDANLSSAVAVGDLNHDSVLDIVLAGGGVMLGNGDATFTVVSPPVSPLAGSPAGLSLGDFNHDGVLDLASTTTEVAEVSLGNGDGTFGKPVVLTKGPQLNSIASGDLNEDGRLDIVVSSEPDVVIGENGSILVFFGNGDGTFVTGPTLAGGPSPMSLILADLDLDGHLDIVDGAEPTAGVRVNPGNGDGTFRAAIALPMNNYSRFDRIVVGDLNRDGKLDIAAAISTLGTYGASVLLNVSQ